MIRSSILQPDVPDGDWNPVYTAERLETTFNSWDESDRVQSRPIGSRRTVYVVTQWTLDFFFPLVIGAFYGCLVARLLPRRFLAFVLPAIVAAVVFDWGENLMLSILAWKGAPAEPSWLVSASRFFTQAKYALFFGTLAVILVLSVLVPARLIYRDARKSRSGKDAFWYTLGRLWDNFLGGIALLVQLRFPLLAITALLLWAPLSCFNDGLKPLAANVLLVDNFAQVASLAWINGLAIIFSVAMLRKLYHNNRSAIDPTYRMRKWTIDAYVVALLMSVVTPVIAVHYSHDQLALWRQSGLGVVFLNGIAASVIGFMCSLVAAAGLVFVMGALFGNIADDENYFPFEDRNQQALLRKKAIPYHSEWKMLSYFALLFFCYLVVLPAVTSSDARFLSISVYFVILIWMVAMVLSAMSAFFDRARIPIIALLIVLVVALRLASERANYLPAMRLSQSSTFTSAVHTLVTAERDQHDAPAGEPNPVITQNVEHAKQELEDIAWEAVHKRMSQKGNSERPKGKRVLTVITCPGGGIHAAAWSAYVLEQLDRRYRDFSDSIVVISGVSGGSVGTVFFAHARYLSDTSQPLDGTTWRLAAKSSLEAIGQAVVFHDLPSSLSYPPIQQRFFPLPGTDRGQGLEDSWKQRLDSIRKNASLESWGTRAVQGQMPIIVLGAMDAVSGRRVLFGSVPTPRRKSLEGRTGRPWDYRELIKNPETDLHIATAARASATFPYVSPFTRPEDASELGERVALGDGGYSDNEGIVTAIDWLDFIAQRGLQERERNGGKELPFDRVLLLRIQPSSDADAPPPESTSQLAKIQSQFRWLAGPLEALASMRSTSQVERGQLEVDLAMSASTSDGSSNRASADAAGLPKSARRPSSPNMKWSRPSIQSEIYRGNVAIQRSIQLQTRSNEALLEKQKELLQPELEAADPTEGVPILSSMMQELAAHESVENATPLLICTIPFVAPEPDADVPLNWKLSPRQLTWYPLAWNSLLKAATEPSAGQSVNFLALLDSIFELRAKRKGEAESER